MVVEALPTLIHVSVSLFFAGLVVFLWNVNLTIFNLVLSWISVCAALYGCITFIPLFLRDSPYYSPLTPLAWPLVVVILTLSRILCFGFLALFYCFSYCFPCHALVRISGRLYTSLLLVQDLAFPTVEEAALASSSEIDTLAFMWAFSSLDEDQELERFFAGMPGFHNSKLLKEPLRFLNEGQKLRLLEAVIRLLDRTFSSNLLLDHVKHQRADICANAMDLVDTPGAFPAIVRRLASEYRYGPIQSTEILDFVRRWGIRKGEDTTSVQAIFSIVVARVQRHDDSWFKLASNELGIPETVLRGYAAQGDNLSLAILIYVTRQQFIHVRNPSWSTTAISDVLRAASKFKMQDTSPELQHEFCALWNQMVREAQKGTSHIPEDILGPIRNLYIALHQGTNSAPTRFSPSTGDEDINLWDRAIYPVCTVPGHIHDDSTLTAVALTVPHDDAALSPASLASPVGPSFPLTAPVHVDNSLTTVPPLDNSNARQTTESSRVPVTSEDQATAGAMRDSVTAGITHPLPTPETSAPTPPPLSTSLPASVSLQQSANLLAPFCPPNFPSSASSNPALDNILHTGPLLCSRSPITRLITRDSYCSSQRFSRSDLCD
jgi:hypothetical protein